MKNLFYTADSDRMSSIMNSFYLMLGYCIMVSSGTTGGTLALFLWSLLSRGGLEDLRELDLATLEVLGSTIPLLTFVICFWGCRLTFLGGSCLWSPLTMVFRSRISVGVISDGSTSGRGLLVDLSIWLLPTIEAHCRGSPTYFPSCLSNPVCTRCSKLVGGEIRGFFFFFVNILLGFHPC